MKIVSDDSCLGYEAPGHPESPARVARTLALLRAQTELPIDWVRPGSVSERAIARVHQQAHLRALEEPRGFDADTPFHPGIATLARQSAGGALTAMEIALQGEASFSLLRPPGHHAYAQHAMGFCYLNQAAITAAEALARGLSVAVFDFDVHHGNGTEAALLTRRGSLYVSVHQYPGYPGTGREHRGNARNYPMLPGTPRREYCAGLARGLDVIAAERPDLLIVSAGFDAFVRDPLSDERLEIEDYEWLGRAIGGLGIKHCSILEGGYSGELPQLILAYLQGLVA
ncbi:MAG: histone deacetylase family protein [Planctomycetota bacterium]